MKLIPVIFILSLPLLIFVPAAAQDDWQLVDESDIRLPDVETLSNALDGGDVDGDGDLDILVANDPFDPWFDGIEQLFINSGLGYFSLADSGSFPVLHDNTAAILLFDCEADRDLDAFAGNYNQESDYMAINDGSGNFTMDSDRITPDTASSLVADYADIDFDGDIDILVLGNSEYWHPNRMWINDGMGYFNSEIFRLPPLRMLYRDAEFADITGDLSPDLILTHREANGCSLTVLINDGTGNFTDETEARVPGLNFLLKAKPIDIDFDGDFDILASDQNRCAILINDGHGYFADESEARAPNFPDFNGDGVPDVQFPQAIASFDPDNDGDEDLLIGDGNLLTRDLVYVNTGGGYFEDQTTLRGPDQVQCTWAFFTGDLDSDGDADIFRTGSCYAPSVCVNTLDIPDSIPPHIKTQTIFPPVDTAVGPYSVRLIAKDGVSIPYELSVRTYYSTDGMSFESDSMHYTGAYAYYGIIPTVDSGQTLYYYYTAADKCGNTSSMPEEAPDSVYSFIYLSVPTDIEDRGSQVPQHLNISAYPNPFNSTTILRFDLPQAAQVEMVIYNILGQRVISLINRQLPPGHHAITWNGRNTDGRAVASGVYFTRIVAGEKVAVKKMLLLK